MKLHIRKKRVLFCLALTGAIAAAFASCGWPQPPADDAGTESFMRQVVPILQGRKVKGYEELKLLTDIATATNRKTVLNALMAQPKYVSHWSEVFVDDLRVNREGSQQQNTCYGAPLRAGSPTSALADSILASAPSTAINPNFNMTDVLSSALVLDNVFPLYEAHLFAMENKPVSSIEPEKRAAMGSTFGQVYLHREMLCLTCHNSEFSLSGESTGWDRTWPLRGYLEQSLFGSSTGGPIETAYAMFRTDVLSTVTGGSSPIEPWGLTNCGMFDTTLPNDPQNHIAQFGDIPPSKQVSVFNLRTSFKSGYNGLDADGVQYTLPPSVQATCDFCEANCTGTTVDITAIVANADFTADVKTLLTATDWDSSSNTHTCRTCHSAGVLQLGTGADWANEMIGKPVSGSSKKYVDPGNANNSYLINKLTGTGMLAGVQMPNGFPAMSAPNIQKVRDWINSMPALTACGVCGTTDCSGPANYVAGNEALAFMTAANVVDNIWAEAMGAPLTIGNYFSRNSSEHQALRDMTQYHFIPQHWSVQAVLDRALTSRFFNRLAPSLSSTTTPAYVIPPTFNPWIVADPREPPVSDPGYVASDHPENHLNSMGEGVYRYGARNLINSVHESLGWPAPARFPANTGYANKEFQRAIGQYFTDSSPGFRGTDLQGMIAWENVHGACEKPSGVASDWIDGLMTAINAVGPMDPAGPVTVEQAVVIMRDWMLGNGTISSSTAVGLSGSEYAALTAYFGVPDLTVPVSGLADAEEALRGYCGVLVETPQFMLAGVAPTGLGPEPRLRVCNSSPCTYQDMCNELASSVNAQLDGKALICGSDSVAVVPIFNPPDILWYDWCIGPGCGLLVDFVPQGCFQEVFNPPRGASACTVETPACDVRYAEIGSCGGEIPAYGQRGERSLSLVWADGVRVLDANGVMIRTRGSTRFATLRAGSTLAYGDLLALPVGATFRIDGDLADVETPRNGVPRDIPGGMVFMAITGEEAVREQADGEGLAEMPIGHIRRDQQGWAKYGEAGTPLTAADLRGITYPELSQRR